MEIRARTLATGNPDADPDRTRSAAAGVAPAQSAGGAVAVAGNGRASAADRHAALVASACRRIARAEQAPSLESLASEAGLSPFHFHRVFKATTGLTPKAYAEAHRAGRVRAELARGRSVTEAIYGAGFNSNSRFYERADRVLGMKPASFRNGGAGTTIRFAVGECSLGAILVAQSERGVCAILLGDDAERLVHDLQDRFPKSQMVGGDAAFEDVVARVVGMVEQPALGLDLPLDVRGTAFQERVWQALQQVGAGETTTYAAIAAEIGAPSAVRAVARACAANPLAVAIPCHRVLRRDGALSGYRWGVERKRALLDREATAGAEAGTRIAAAPGAVARLRTRQTLGSMRMNDDQVKGKLDQLKGGIKQGVGGAVGDKRTEREGTADRLGGKVQEGIGNLKEKIKGRDPQTPRE